MRLTEAGNRFREALSQPNADVKSALDNSYGYFVVLGIIAVLCIGLYARFKRARWI
ncbi:hypothetical protein [Phyllobacterium ifriqiyense]|uniref:hypothetical protein n=1 Tax=Phyllobacterium ifriqiyense TaxID=314238 RepID=UPI00349A716B